MFNYLKKLFLILIGFSNLINSIYCLNNKPKNKTALVYGITGQDGCYLSKFLLEKGYKIYGVTRNVTTSNTQNLFMMIKELDESVKQNLILLKGDITDHSFVLENISKILPNEIYNLAAQSSVKTSFQEPVHTLMVDAVGTLNILVAMHSVDKEKKIKFYQASTCEIFGKTKCISQNELTPFYPRSPYGVAKACAFWSTVNFREAYNMYACNGIMFNHESPLRPENFVTRSITKGIARIKKGIQSHISLGNLNATRDWGFAGDYVVAMWLMLQQEKPEDFIIATGESHTVREFVEIAFKEVGIDVEWHGEGLNEIGIDKITGKKLVTVDSEYFRPTEIDFLMADTTKAKMKLKWRPKINFNHLVKIMMRNDINMLK